MQIAIEYRHYHAICEYLRNRTGVDLGDGKEYLVEGRLASVLEQFKLKNYEELLAQMDREINPCFSTAVIDSLMTNESLFFRDQFPFECLTQFMIPEILKTGFQGGPIKVWSSACSTGQEPYSMAMAWLDARDQFPSDLQLEILATDICSCAMERAIKGSFSEFEIQRGLTPQQLERFFKREKDSWKVSPEVARMVKFQRSNLTKITTVDDSFHVIFCRNVLIYFNDETKHQVVSDLIRRLAPGGFLALGGAEGPLGSRFPELENIRNGGTAVFRKI